TEVLYARERVVVAAAAAGVDAIDTLHVDYRDEAGLREDAAFGRRLGYDGKLAIHPAQVPVINEAFSPDDEDVAWAKKVLRARDEAAREGRGVFGVDGEMIDAPARQTGREHSRPRRRVVLSAPGPTRRRETGPARCRLGRTPDDCHLLAMGVCLNTVVCYNPRYA
ncbi:citrate-lyase, partial [Haloferax sp. BAB-2207]